MTGNPEGPGARTPDLAGAPASLLQAIDASIDTGIAVVDRHGTQIHVNDAMCRLVGWTRQELVNHKPPFVYWAQEDTPQILTVFESALQGSLPHEGAIVRLLHRDGRRFPARIQVSPLKIDGEAQGWVAAVVDVSAPVAAHQAPAASERRFRELADHIRGGVLYVRDIDRHAIVYASPSYEYIWGQPVKALQDKPESYRDAIDPAYRTRADEAFASQLGGRATSVEYPIVRPDASRRWIWDQSYPLQEDGSRRIVGIAIDITRRREAEDALQNQLDQLTEAERLASLGSCLIEPTQRTLHCSEGFRRLLGLPAERLPTLRGALRPVLPQDRRAVLAAVRSIETVQPDAGSPPPADTLIRCRGDGGDLRQLHLRASRAHSRQGSGALIVVTVQDVTARERMSAELAQHRDRLEELVNLRTRELDDARRKADAASRAKGEFLSNISHEIRTPMSAILGIAHLLREDSSDPELRERIRGLEASAHQMLALVNDVLDLSKIEAGRLTIDTAEVDLRELVGDVIAVCRESAAAKGLAIGATVDVAVPNCVVGDRLRIGQVLLNLLSNAVKFTQRGSVRIDVRWKEPTSGHGSVLIEVQDTGPGIALEDRARIFEPFEQGHPPVSARNGGTGLGLAICRRLVTLMGGRLDVRSQVGVGSVFIVELPLAAARNTAVAGSLHAGSEVDPRPQPVTTTTPEPILSRGTILVVDDNRINRLVTCDILRRRGYDVHAASSGTEAIEMASRTGYDAILMDLRMPGVDGVAAAREIRQRGGDGSPTIIGMSGNIHFGDHGQWHDSGMDGFIAKPVRPQVLLTTVSDAVASATARRRPPAST